MVTKTVSEIAALCGAELEGDGSGVVVGPAPIDDAEPDQISFLGHPKYRAELERTRAGAVLVDRETRCGRSDLVLLRCENPSRAFTEVVRSFAPRDDGQVPGVHPTAVVDERAELGADVAVGPLSCVGSGARLGDGVRLVGSVWVGSDVQVGARSVVHPGVVLYPRVRVGRGVTIHGGSVLGADGFGFERAAEGWERIPQCGTVIVEDDVEIGAGCTVDRARFGATRIGRGALLDDQVHVAHNVVVGPGAMLVAQVGLAGSARVGAGAILAGQAGVADHVEIGEQARVAGGAGVLKRVPAGETWSGLPARPMSETQRSQAHLRRLAALFGEVRRLQERVEELERRRGEPT